VTKIQLLGIGRKDGKGGYEPLKGLHVTSTNPEAVKKAVDKIRNIIKEAVDSSDKFCPPSQKHARAWYKDKKCGAPKPTDACGDSSG
jgi:hypothetical protein